MNDDVKTDIAVIKEKLSNMSDQMKRFIAHVDSERDVRSEQGKRIDLLQKDLNRMQDEREKDKQSGKWRIETILSILALVISIIIMIRG